MTPKRRKKVCKFKFNEKVHKEVIAFLKRKKEHEELSLKIIKNMVFKKKPIKEVK